MIERNLLNALDQVAARAHRLRLRRSLAISWSILALLAAAIYFLPQTTRAHFALAVPILCLAAAILFLATRGFARRDEHHHLQTARAIEAKYPALDAKLLAALKQIDDARASNTQLGYLQSTVIRQAADHADQHDWNETVPSPILRRWGFAQAAATVALLAVLAGFIIHAEPFTTAPVIEPTLVANPADPANTLTVEPGDIELERGSSLIVTARFAQRIPANTTLIIEGSSAAATPSPSGRGPIQNAAQPRFESGEGATPNLSSDRNRALPPAHITRSIPMTASLDDPLAGARVSNIASDLTYRITAEGIASPTYTVKVFDYPALVQADATLRYPDYTALGEKVIEDTRQVTAVEGTRITWTLQLNKPVASAKLTSETGDEIVLQPSAVTASAVTGSLTITKSARYKLSLTDDAGRKNKRDVEFVITALTNRPPDLKLVFPRRDLRVSPIEEALIVAEAWDDFGLKAVGITWSMAGREPVETTLAKDIAGRSKQEVRQLLAFEAMKAVPDQLLSYHFWADDIGPDGKVRRTFGDMFFAEVRPFEEIFREGEAPPGSEQQQQQQQQQQGQQQQIGEAIKSQREIITATWNLIRRETPGSNAEPTVPFKEDAAAVRDAQQEQLEKISAVKEELADAQSLAHVEAVEKHMTAAASHLAAAAEKNAPPALKLALPEEQAAYQALLKLQAREHEVIKAQRQRQQQRGQQQGQQQAGPSQQQLNELELNNQENRYEQQSTAQEQQEDPAKRETRQALNRLRDLARRQQDLNEKLKEMELAMQEAKSAQEKEELARQLKRLREQQEEMLRDVDELKNRMEQAQSQQAQQQNQQNQQNQQSQNQQANAQNQQNQNQKQQDAKQANAEERRQREEMNDARQQVEEARQNIKESAEALEKGLTSKALAEGTRAERKLTELKEEFRKRAAGEFAEDVKEMRRDARQLADKQEALTKKLDDLNKPGQPRTLRDTGERKQVAEALGEQKEKLGGLTDKMKKVTEEAETSEPLLSKQLYETLRSAEQQQVEQALDVTRQLLDKGFNDEAKQVAPQARKGIDDLKKGVEKAAESVLGDEAESLRRARQALDDLAKQAEREGGERESESLARGDEKRAGPSPAPVAEPQNKNDKQGEQPSQRGEPKGTRGEDAAAQEGGAAKGAAQRPTKGPSFLDQAARSGTGASSSGAHGPITGEDFREWSDKLRDVEEMIDDPKLREEVARVRDRAKAMRAEFKRHGKTPQWDEVKKLIAQPLVELRDKLDDELARRDNKRELVPIDRDPVPSEFSDLVRKYYEKLGAGE